MTPIGSFVPENRFFLAPMEAVNCASFRVLCKRRGAAVVYTDMIDTDMFVEYANAHSVSAAIEKYINAQADEQPLVIQLGGSKIDNILFCMRELESYCIYFDYNVGCPLPYMLGKKGGCYLMKHPNQLYKLVRAMRTATQKPLSYKLRLGWDEKSINVVEIAIELEKLGVDVVTVHGRTRQQRYRDRADWQTIRKVKEAVSIPVILSGDVTNAYMACMALAHTKCDYIMVARGAQHNPSIFSQLVAWDKTGDVPPKPNSTYEKHLVDPILDFVEFVALYKEREKRYKISELKDHALWTVKEAKNNTELKQQILDAISDEELISIVKKAKF